MKKINELKNEINKLKKLLNKYKYDYLTGFKMRLDFEDKLKEVESKVNYHEKTYQLVMLDLDNLHNINRTEGYEYGDKILKRLSTYLGDIFDPSNIYRIGGDEFFIISEGSLDKNIINRLSNIPIDITYATVLIKRNDNNEHIFLDDIKKSLDDEIISKKNKLKRRKNDR